MLTDQCISMVIYDRVKDKLVVYNSSKDFDLKTVCEINNRQSNKKEEYYTNENYNDFAFN